MKKIKRVAISIKNKFKGKLLLGLLLLIIALTIFVLSEKKIINIDNTFTYIDGKDKVGWALFVILFALASVVAFPIVVFMLASGIMYGPVLGTILSTLGILFGATLSFLTSRYLFHDFFQKYFTKHKYLQWSKSGNQKHLFTASLLTRIIPIAPFSALNYGWALTKIKLKNYMLATFIGDIPGTILYVYLGHTLIGRQTHKILFAIILIAIFTAFGIWLRNKLSPTTPELQKVNKPLKKRR